MAKVFRPNNKESILLSKIESSKERDRRLSINIAKDHTTPLSNSIAMKLVENKYIETTSKNSLEEQIFNKLEEITRADDFDIDYQTTIFTSFFLTTITFLGFLSCMNFKIFSLARAMA